MLLFLSINNNNNIIIIIVYYDCHHHHHDFLLIDEEGWGRSSLGRITSNGEAAHKDCWEFY